MDEPYTQVPNRIIDKLQMRGVAIYCFIARFNPTYYGGEVKMAKTVGIRRSTLRTYLDSLIAMGFIKKTVRPGQSSIYEVVQLGLGYEKKAPRRCTTGTRGPVQLGLANKKKINKKEEKEKTSQAFEGPDVSVTMSNKDISKGLGPLIKHIEKEMSKDGKTFYDRH